MIKLLIKRGVKTPLNLNIMEDYNKAFNDKFPKLDQWFADMDKAFSKIKDSHEKGKINNLLIDNDIETIK